jgi:hypothetical protein
MGDRAEAERAHDTTDDVTASRAARLTPDTQPTVRRRLAVGAVDDPAEHEADRLADAALAVLRSTELGSTRVRRSTASSRSPDPVAHRRVRPAAPVHRSHDPAVIRRAYVNGTAEKDLPLFKLQDPKSGDNSLGTAAAKAAKLGITAFNMPHYLERHTFGYQRLSGKTTKQRAGMFPTGTSADDVKKMLLEAVGKLPDDAAVGEAVTSETVDLANGLKVNLGALKGGKLSAFFPIGGTGYHYYDDGELNEIRKAKNAKADDST